MTEPDAIRPAPLSDRKPPFTPKRFGRYELIDRISRGGMSDIYLAKTAGIDGFQKPIVIKKLLPEYSEKPRYVQRFINEGKTLSHLNHANIVQILDMGLVDGEYYIALEYIEGRNVAHLLAKAKRNDRPPSLEFCLHVVLELAKGLAYAHRRRGPHGEGLMLVHQDINSFNVMVSYEAEVKIIDFGIARIFLEPSGWQGLPVAGKLLYFSPEQLKGQNIDHRVDIYGTGVLFYELIAGERLIQHQQSIGDTVKMILQTDVNERIRNNERIPEIIRPVLERSMARDPDDRYAWMEDMAAHIRSLIREHGLELDHAKFVTYLVDVFPREMSLDARRLRRLMDETPPPPAPAQPLTASDLQAFPDEVVKQLSMIADERGGDAEPPRLPARTVNYPAGRMIFRQGDQGTDCYVIRTGKVRLFLRSGRSEQTVAVLGEGDFFGEATLVEKEERNLNATALEDTTCLAIEREWFARLVPHDVSRVLVLRLVERLRDSVWLLGGPLFQDPLCRFIYGLIFLYRRNIARNGSEVDLAELMELLRLEDRDLVDKYLAKLQALQIIEVSEPAVRIKNIEKLENILELLAGEKKLTLKL